jgi:hypothetical protein
MRIFTDINLSKERGKYHLDVILQALILKRKDSMKDDRAHDQIWIDAML